ncbi:MAG: ribosome maturation factor RimP [Deltaproteobacteria bacterium]|nr:ribosome maturation factor RimP [Deltaproteobacteria bacterium]
MDKSVAERVWALAEPLAQQEGLEIVDAEFRREGRGMVLRLYLDRAGGVAPDSPRGMGVTLDELARFSRQLGDVLDVHQAVPGSYTLETSSPGIDRRLRVPAQFARYLGKRVRLRLLEPLAGRRTLLGLLKEVRDDGILVDAQPEALFVRYAEISQANYEHEFGRQL